MYFEFRNKRGDSYFSQGEIDQGGLESSLEGVLSEIWRARSAPKISEWGLSPNPSPAPVTGTPSPLEPNAFKNPLGNLQESLFGSGGRLINSFFIDSLPCQKGFFVQPDQAVSRSNSNTHDLPRPPGLGLHMSQKGVNMKSVIRMVFLEGCGLKAWTRKPDQWYHSLKAKFWNQF